jgi:hypothetical protein
MATLRTVTVKPSGGDYTSLSAAEAGEQGNLVTLDRQLDIQCYSMSDTTNATISGSTTDATRYINIYTPDADRHDGKWNTAKYRLEPTDTATALRIEDEYVRVRGLQIQIQSPTAARIEVSYGFVSDTSDNYLEQCIIRGSGANSAGLSVGASTSGNLKVSNCLIYDCTTSFAGGIRYNATNCTLYVYNTTLVGCYYGVRRSGGTVIVKNTLSKATASTRDFVLDSGSWGAGSNYNSAAGTTSTGGANDRTSQTFTFADETNKDFHLASTDAGARDYGVDLSGDAYPVTVDIDGVTRSGSWDIGADEYVAGGGPTGNPWYYYAQQ